MTLTGNASVTVESGILGTCSWLDLPSGTKLFVVSSSGAVTVNPGIAVQSGGALWKSGSGNVTFMGPLSNSGSAIFDGGGVLFGAPVHSGF